MNYAKILIIGVLLVAVVHSADPVTYPVLNIENHTSASDVACSPSGTNSNKFYINLHTKWYWGDSNTDAGKQILATSQMAYVLGLNLTLKFDSTYMNCGYPKIEYVSLSQN